MAIPSRIIDVIGVPSDFGANMRGANIGPAAVRIAGLSQMMKNLGQDVRDLGDVNVPVREEVSKAVEEQRYLPVIRDICETVSTKVFDSLSAKHFPLVIGGDHSIAIGTISGAADYWRSQKKKLGIVWIDAHADLNNNVTSPSGNYHGMPLAIVLGDGEKTLTDVRFPGAKIQPQNIALIGIRNIDGNEREQVKRSGVRYYTMRSIDEKGMYAVMKEVIADLTKTCDAIHLSFDIDGIDPLYAPGVSTPVTGGISYREAHLALEMLADTGLLMSAEFVELNPFQDQAHKTAILTAELVLSALGKAIV